jgi:hypothetical protein
MFTAFDQLMDGLLGGPGRRCDGMAERSGRPLADVRDHQAQTTSTQRRPRNTSGSTALVAAGLQEDGDFELALDHDVGLVD